MRAVSSRKLKAKFLVVKGLIACQTSGFFDPRFIVQSLQILGSAWLYVLERIVLETAAETARKAGRERDVQDFEREIRQLLEKAHADLHLVHPTPERIETLPVSLIC